MRRTPSFQRRIPNSGRAYLSLRWAYVTRKVFVPLFSKKRETKIVLTLCDRRDHLLQKVAFQWRAVSPAPDQVDIDVEIQIRNRFENQTGTAVAGMMDE